MTRNEFTCLLVFLLIPALLLGTFGFVSAEEVPAGLTYEIVYEWYETSGGTIKITGYTGNDSILVIPAMIEGKPVRTIGYSAFSNNTKLQGIIIPSGVTTINDSAFYLCSSLGSISIPNTVTSIGKWAFYGCSSLSNINIPDSVNVIDDYAFQNCSNLRKVTLPKELTQLSSHTFRGCSSLSSINLEKVTNYGWGTLSGCSSLKNIKLAGSLTSIPGAMFSGCSNLTSVSIPSGVTSIGGSAFEDCRKLTSINIPTGVTSIGQSAFKNCSGLSAIELPKGLASIEALTFAGCTGLRSIKIPGKVNSIGNGAFGSCTGLTSINIPSSVTSIGDFAFAACSNLSTITIPISVTSIGKKLFGNFYYGATFRSYPFSYAEKYAKANNINFVALPLIQVTDINLNSQGFSLQTGEKYTLSAQVAPENATYKAVSWTSSNTDVAMVTTDGQVMGVNIGQVIINAQAKDGSNVSVSCVVAVVPAGNGISLSPGASMVPVGGSQQLNASVTEAGTSLPALTWTSSKEVVATVDQSGLVTGVAPGTATITVSATDGSGMKASSGIRVHQLITELRLEPKTFHLHPGKSLSLVPHIQPENASNKTLVWICSDTDVAIVNSKGLVKALKEGVATISAKSQDGSGWQVESQLTVSHLITNLSLSENTLSLSTGDNQTIAATIQPNYATDKSLSWDSSDTTIAMVDDNGLVTATAPGTATITARTNDGSDLNASCIITVSQPITRVSLDKATARRQVQTSLQLNATVEPENATDKSLTWNSSDKTVATVNDTGLVTTTNKTGTVIITVTTADGSKLSDSCVLSVTEKAPEVVKGDANDSGTLDIGDIDSVINYLVNGIPCIAMDNADADDNGEVELADLIWIVQQLAK